MDTPDSCPRTPIPVIRFSFCTAYRYRSSSEMRGCHANRYEDPYTLVGETYIHCIMYSDALLLEGFKEEDFVLL